MHSTAAHVAKSSLFNCQSELAIIDLHSPPLLYNSALSTQGTSAVTSVSYGPTLSGTFV